MFKQVYFSYPTGSCFSRLRIIYLQFVISENQTLYRVWFLSLDLGIFKTKYDLRSLLNTLLKMVS